MKRMLIVGAVACLVVGSVSTVGWASWVGTYCFIENASVSAITRITARAYAEIAAREGYEWGGGCWNDNARDDTPNAPDSGGEGPDCSGLVFKSWYLRLTWAASGFHRWNKMQNIHGYYASDTFHAPTSDLPFHKLSNKYRSTTVFMDAFAKNGHVGLLDTSAYPSSGGDYVMEAKGDTVGTNIFIENYRSDSAYVAVRREGWATQTCTGTCPKADLTEETIAVP
jgi:hypothetical protein